MANVIRDLDHDRTRYSPVCTFCKHEDPEVERKCRAFDKIPLEIWEGRNLHREPYPGDGGIRFELMEEV